MLAAPLTGSNIGCSIYPALGRLSLHLRAYSSDNKTATLQRLSRAARHRSLKSKHASESNGSSSPKQSSPSLSEEAAASPISTAVMVTPSETQATDLQLSQVLSHSALIITRPIEWGTIIFGYEQANKYQVYDQDGKIVALIAEDYTGLGNEVGRQLLRTRRGFTATVFSADGAQVIFRVRRPAYLITSTMYIEDGKGEVLGEVHRRWSMIQRNYDLYMNKKQFASITGNFLAWEFELKDERGGTLGLIDRNFQGFGKELFTDAGKYVIHFGQLSGEADANNPGPQPVAEPSINSSTPPVTSINSSTPPVTSINSSTPPVTSMAAVRTGVAVIPTSAGNQLAVARSMELSERMITLACAISVDYDFFSQHSHGGGLVGGFMPYYVPVPSSSQSVPGTESGATTPGSSDGAAGAGASGAAQGAAGGVPMDHGSSESGLERDLGGDEWGGTSEASKEGGGSFGSDDQEIKWDQGDGDDSGGEGSGGVGGVIGTIWGWVSGGD
ncbi:hypothetical protein CEUSTIGMA_g3461.t1 [Chlamydomonas eustigma]|uniref:Phospholipid scramblase n=1 Tax=Chlamydomonas eustigma TaxID=1157962 RepID=A0A250WYV0_9CHLO|nr:hypothetical protein CEUSTIGMA_g3461.t1 [Chlamydomonas eustigma]|eukprot:GAX76018.1 hypothetical protein CEUSTIGMA_g3461.t1 [Chlamydomonas eustigma]